MTRINCVPPSELSDLHLGAEYRELPRVFALVHKAIQRGETHRDSRNPDQYVLGEGHVRFFYPRLGYLLERFDALVFECKARGRVCNFDKPPELINEIPREFFGGWTPTDIAMMLNRERIKLRSPSI